MISPTEYLCSKMKELSGLYGNAQKLHFTYKSLDTVKKKKEEKKYQKEIVNYISRITEQLKFIDNRRNGIIYLNFDLPYEWESYFYTQRKNIGVGQYTTAECFKVLNQMLKLVKKVYLHVKKVVISLDKACVVYMNAINTLVKKHGRGSDKAIAAAPLKKFITILEHDTLDATNFFVERLFYPVTYKDISKAITIGDVSEIGKSYGNVHANLKTISSNSAQATKYLSNKINIK